MQWWIQKIQVGAEIAFTALVAEGETIEDACREYIRKCEEKREKRKKWYVHFAKLPTLRHLAHIQAVHEAMGIPTPIIVEVDQK